jgi:hypothetical protein
MIERNMGFTDQSTRVVIGAALIFAAAFGAIGAWGYLGLIPLLTGLLGRCPAYTLMDVSTKDPD